MFENETIQQMAERNDKTIAQVVLRWLVQRRCTVIFKSRSIDRIQENMKVQAVAVLTRRHLNLFAAWDMFVHVTGFHGFCSCLTGHCAMLTWESSTAWTKTIELAQGKCE